MIEVTVVVRNLPNIIPGGRMITDWHSGSGPKFVKYSYLFSSEPFYLFWMFILVKMKLFLCWLPHMISVSMLGTYPKLKLPIWRGWQYSMESLWTTTLLWCCCFGSHASPVFHGLWEKSPLSLQEELVVPILEHVVVKMQRYDCQISDSTETSLMVWLFLWLFSMGCCC